MSRERGRPGVIGHLAAHHRRRSEFGPRSLRQPSTRSVWLRTLGQLHPLQASSPCSALVLERGRRRCASLGGSVPQRVERRATRGSGPVRALDGRPRQETRGNRPSREHWNADPEWNPEPGRSRARNRSTVPRSGASARSSVEKECGSGIRPFPGASRDHDARSATARRPPIWVCRIPSRLPDPYPESPSARPRRPESRRVSAKAGAEPVSTRMKWSDRRKEGPIVFDGRRCLATTEFDGLRIAPEDRIAAGKAGFGLPQVFR